MNILSSPRRLDEQPGPIRAKSTKKRKTDKNRFCYLCRLWDFVTETKYSSVHVGIYALMKAHKCGPPRHTEVSPAFLFNASVIHTASMQMSAVMMDFHRNLPLENFSATSDHMATIALIKANLCSSYYEAGTKSFWDVFKWTHSEHTQAEQSIQKCFAKRMIC